MHGHHGQDQIEPREGEIHFSSLPSSTFSCQWKSSTIIWQGFFGAIKARHSTHKSRWKSPGWHRCAPREGHCSLKGEHGSTWESKKDASATSLRRQHNFRLPLQLGYAKPHHLAIFVLWSCSENVLGAMTSGNLQSCQLSLSGFMLLLPIQAVNRKCICYNPKLVFKPLNDLRSTEWIMRSGVKLHFSYSKPTDRIPQDILVTAATEMDTSCCPIKSCVI